ncbi:TSUP family transporter [Propionicicella superfundia]|uniref:TSUP family transporter n=1 Tax=Propionicicella superfundia TaxID=348582 RepID=UPI0004110460|nr:TSUP family transporter [Propionicicella superfundia]
MIWAVTALVAVLIALDKALLPGSAILGVALLAGVVPAKEATGTTLALILVADLAAIWAYRRDVEWRTLLRLLPNVAAGVAVGAGFLFVADDALVGRTIGAILLVFLAINAVATVRRRRRGRRPAGGLGPVAGEPASTGETTDGVTAEEGPAEAGPAEVAARRGTRAKRIVFGALAGFTTMVANAGGPVTSMYFMTEGFPVLRFLATTAWFYLIVNLVKLPFSIGLGMIGTQTLPVIAAMAPVIVGTVLLARRLARRIDRRVFNALVLALTVVTAVRLLVAG